MHSATDPLFSDDVLRVVFTNIDPKDPEREFSIVIDMSRQEYRGTGYLLFHRDIVRLPLVWSSCGH